MDRRTITAASGLALALGSAGTALAVVSIALDMPARTLGISMIAVAALIGLALWPAVRKDENRERRKALYRELNGDAVRMREKAAAATGGRSTPDNPYDWSRQGL